MGGRKERGGGLGKDWIGSKKLSQGGRVIGMRRDRLRWEGKRASASAGQGGGGARVCPALLQRRLI